MKGSALLETMARQAGQQTAALLEDARRHKENILADARERAIAARESALAAANAEKALLDQRWELKAQSEAAKADLAMKNDAVNAVLAKVESEIRRIVDAPEFPDTLDLLLAQLMRAAEGDVVVLAPEKHVDHVRWWLENNGRDGVPVEGSREVWDGVAIQDPARTYRISNTLTGRYARVEAEARRRCMIGLFGAAGGER